MRLSKCQRKQVIDPNFQNSANSFYYQIDTLSKNLFAVKFYA